MFICQLKNKHIRQSNIASRQIGGPRPQVPNNLTSLGRRETARCLQIADPDVRQSARKTDGLDVWNGNDMEPPDVQYAVAGQYARGATLH